jgi:hypothetical protein
MPDESPLSPRFVVWSCDHCRNRIEFDAVQLAGRDVCRISCPHCGQKTRLQEPPPPPPLIPDEGWTQPAQAETLVAPEPEKIIVEPPPRPPVVSEPVAEIPAAEPPTTLVPKSITVSLPPDPLPPTHTRAPVDVRWLTDLGVVYFKQHQFGEAFLCFSRAAQQGFATAQFCLAVCYFNGHGTARDETAALPWLRQAAAQGDANAEFTLGLAYSLGRGVARLTRSSPRNGCNRPPRTAILKPSSAPAKRPTSLRHAPQLIWIKFRRRPPPNRCRRNKTSRNAGTTCSASCWGCLGKNKFTGP